MKIKIISVHPSFVRIESNGISTDIPSDWFQEKPTEGQIWDIALTRARTDSDRIADLNHLLGHA